MENDLAIRSSYLATKESLPKRLLTVGKIANDYQANNYLFYLIEINCSSEIADRIKQILLENLKDKKDIFNQAYLEKVIEKINTSLESAVKSGLNGWLGNLNAVIGVIEDNSLSLANHGDITGYLIRKGKISTLIEKTEASTLSQKTFTDLTSGFLNTDDRVIFGNKDFYDFYALDMLRRSFENSSSKKFAFSLWNDLKHKKASGLNAIMLETVRADESEIEAINMPEFFFIDEKEESAIEKAKKKIKHGVREFKKQIKTLSLKIYNLCRIGFSKSKEGWQTTLKPKAKKIIKDSAPFISKSYRNTKEKISPHVKNILKSERFKDIKIKTNLYSKKTESGVSNILKNAGLFIASSFKIMVKKENRKFVYIIFILCFLSIGYLKIKANNQIKDRELETEKLANLYPQAESAFKKAKENIALGKTTGIDELQNSLSIAQDSAKYPGNKDRANALIKEIMQILDERSKTTRYYDPKPLIQSSAKINNSVLAGTEIYTINGEGKIYTVNPDNSTITLVGSIGKDQGAALDLAYSESDNKIYILTSNRKVFAYSIESKTNELLSTGDAKEWPEGASIATFDSNLYVLNNKDGRITKHIKTDTGFSQGTTYADNSKVNLKDSKSIAIDGNVYVLLNNGSASKFSRGVFENDFSLKNLPEPQSALINPSKIITDEDNNHIFVLDRGGNRVVKFNKSGEFVNQYAFEGITAENLMVNSKIQKFWISTENSIYQFDL